MLALCRGVLFVDIRQCEDLPAGDYSGGSSDPYVFLKVAGQKQQTVVMPNTHSPVYNAHYEFYNVQAQDVLSVQVRTRNRLLAVPSHLPRQCPSSDLIDADIICAATA